MFLDLIPTAAVQEALGHIPFQVAVHCSDRIVRFSEQTSLTESDLAAARTP